MRRGSIWAIFILVFLIIAGGILFTQYQSKAKVKSESLSDLRVMQNDNQVKGVKTDEPSPSPAATDTRFVYLGLWTEGFWDKDSSTLHPEVLTRMQTKFRKNVAIAHYYRGWESLDSSQLLKELQTINSYGWRPMISANPYFFSKCPANELPLYRAIAKGKCDEFLKSVGANLKEFAKPIFLRFAWEMNVASMPWQIKNSGSTNQDFIAAWQRMHNIIYAQGASNVLWVFSPDVSDTNYSSIYPGDSFVDWLGLDGYNWGTTQPWSSWKGFSQVFSTAYNSIINVAPNKPLMLAEVNTTNQGGDKSAWYQDMLMSQVPYNFPKVKAVVFYNEDRSSSENVNWLIDITQVSLDVFSKGIQNPIYASSF